MRTIIAATAITCLVGAAFPGTESNALQPTPKPVTVKSTPSPYSKGTQAVKPTKVQGDLGGRGRRVLCDVYIPVKGVPGSERIR